MKRYRGYYITECEDVGENAGGLFCQVYSDEGCDNEVDYFCVLAKERELASEIIEKHIDNLIKENN